MIAEPGWCRDHALRRAVEDLHAVDVFDEGDVRLSAGWLMRSSSAARAQAGALAIVTSCRSLESEEVILVLSWLRHGTVRLGLP